MKPLLLHTMHAAKQGLASPQKHVKGKKLHEVLAVTLPSCAKRQPGTVSGDVGEEQKCSLLYLSESRTWKYLGMWLSVSWLILRLRGENATYR